MKNIKIILFFFILVASLITYGQTSNEKPMHLDGSTTDESSEDFDFQKNNPKRGNWSGIEIGVNSLNGTQSSYLKPLLDIKFNMFDRKIKFKKNENLGLTLGWGISLSDLHVSNTKDLNYNNDSIWSKPSATGKYRSNSLSSMYFNIPILFDYNKLVDGKKKFWFTAGVIASVNIFSDWNTVRKLTFGTLQSDLTGRFNTNWVNLDATIRGGYKFVGVYASYGLVPFFNQSNSGSIFKAGLSFTFKS